MGYSTRETVKNVSKERVYLPEKGEERNGERIGALTCVGNAGRERYFPFHSLRVIYLLSCPVPTGVRNPVVWYDLEDLSLDLRKLGYLSDLEDMGLTYEIWETR